MSARERSQSECGAAMQRIYALSVRDQLEVHRLLSEYLGDQFGRETQLQQKVRARDEALLAMERVARHLSLAAGVAPTVTQYRQVERSEAERAITEGFSSARVIRAWGRYRLAERAFRHESVPTTAAQRSLKAQSSGPAYAYEISIPGVKAWLTTKPAMLRARDYDAYAREHNDALARGEIRGLALARSPAVRHRLRLGWDEVLLLAKGEATYEDLRAQHDKKRAEADSGPLGLISTTIIGFILGTDRTTVYRISRCKGFPKPVATISTRHAWLLSDVVAYREGEAVPKRDEGEMQHLIMGSEEVAERLGLQPMGVRCAVKQHSSTVPPADGHMGNALYWLRTSVEKWLRENPDYMERRRITAMRFRREGERAVLPVSDARDPKVSQSR